ncbi:hypothetical protein N9D90_01920 [Alphaproteobacteria bacterium]|nr:hypothetical protein [Alphaproteobacteria bacterium]
MTDIEPRYFDHPDACLSYLEYAAIKKFVFSGSASDLYKAFDGSYLKSLVWTEKMHANAKQHHTEILTNIGNGSITDLTSFYDAVSAMLKPKPRGKMLKDLKRRNAQKEHQRDNKGEAFIENDRLFSAAAKSAFDLAEARADEAAVALKAAELAGQFDNGTPLNELQMSVLRDYIQQRIDKHQKLDRVEAALIDDPDKNVYYMWGQIKRRCLKDDTIAWPYATAAKLCRCSRTQVPKIMNKLMKLGAITRVQEGKRGANSGRAAIYRREI